tara:strand:+ start:1719 stop:2180 length:462 start_codon:yes stop_codon:yes gene_type:complete
MVTQNFDDIRTVAGYEYGGMPSQSNAGRAYLVAERISLGPNSNNTTSLSLLVSTIPKIVTSCRLILHSSNSSGIAYGIKVYWLDQSTSTEIDLWSGILYDGASIEIITKNTPLVLDSNDYIGVELFENGFQAFGTIETTVIEMNNLSSTTGIS